MNRLMEALQQARAAIRVRFALYFSWALGLLKHVPWLGRHLQLAECMRNMERLQTLQRQIADYNAEREALAAQMVENAAEYAELVEEHRRLELENLLLRCTLENLQNQIKERREVYRNRCLREMVDTVTMCQVVWGQFCTVDKIVQLIGYIKNVEQVQFETEPEEVSRANEVYVQEQFRAFADAVVAFDAEFENHQVQNN